jgi:hypothetical protein
MSFITSITPMLTRKASFGGQSSRCSLTILEKRVTLSAAKNRKNFNPTRKDARTKESRRIPKLLSASLEPPVPLSNDLNVLQTGRSKTRSETRNIPPDTRNKVLLSI